MALSSILCIERPNISGGIWNSKLIGELDEGNAKSIAIITGHLEIKTHKENIRLFFHNISVNKRKAVNEHNKDNDRMIPNLYLFISRKPPKARMTDIHRTGIKVNLHNKLGKDEFHFNGIQNEYDVSLNDISDLWNCHGLVICKLAEDEPVTDEPVIYAMAKFQSSELMNIKTISAMNIKDISETIDSIIHANHIINEKITIQVIHSAIKSFTYYRKIAKKVWIIFELEPDEEINYTTFVQIVDYVNIFMIDAQLQRFFHAVNIKKQSTISVSEFENFLIIYDVMGQSGYDLLLLDMYDTFKIDPNSEYGQFLNNIEGLDFPAYIECIQLLGIKANSANTMKVFCNVMKCKEGEIPKIVMNFNEFKKAWAQLIDVNIELQKRNLQIDKSLACKSRNEELLLREMSSKEDLYMQNLSIISGLIDDMKQQIRQSKDEKRHQDQAIKDKLQHNAARFIAERGQEKRVQLKKEQEERSRKRIEEKVIRNQLLIRQQENKMHKQEELSMNMKQNENLRIEQIRARGWDRLDMSKQNLRSLPTSLYDSEEAKARLSYAIIVDFSKNELEILPELNCLYWLTSVRHFNISTNKLQEFPNEILCLTNVEIFEAYHNRLLQLPVNFGQFSDLIRLDLGSNLLTSLPNSIGYCTSLKYLSCHSNQLTNLPNTIGSCMRLEYVDLSLNKITYLPDEFQFLISLIQFNISSNRLLSLPNLIGHCTKLEYLDLSCNTLSTLPESFSNLINLEYCDLQNNNITLSIKSFSNLTSCIYLNISKNQISKLYQDISGCKNIQKLILDNNNISELPPEIGLLQNLTELNLSYNKLEHIVVEIGACRNLVKLNLSYNQISGDFVDTIALLTNLIDFDVSFNKIQHISESIVGLQKVEVLNMNNNQLRNLPSTVYYLKSLQNLNLASNLFTHFSMDFSKLATLKLLDLSENLIELLPQEIHLFTYLETLNLSKNQLKALPLECIKIIEMVPNLNIDDNPWSLLPPKWGKLYTNKHTIQGGENGYDLPKLLDFIYNMQVFYYPAEKIWELKGHLYYSQRLTFDDFLIELKSKLTIQWDDGLLEYVKFIYFKSKENGTFPKWYILPNEQDHIEIKNKEIFDMNRRNYNVEKSKIEYIEKSEFRKIAYEIDLPRRAKRKEELAAEFRVNEEIFHRKQLQILRKNMSEKGAILDTIGSRISTHRQQEDQEEYLRLLQLMKAKK